MALQIEFHINPELLAAVGRLVSGPKTSISPLHHGGVTDLSEDQRQELAASGLLDARGNISDTVLPTLRALAEANSFTRVRLVAGDQLFEHHVYFSPDEPASIALTTVDEGVIVRQPAPIELVLESLRQHVGDSLTIICPVEAEMPVEQAIVLAAMIDLHRKAFMRAFAAGRPFEPAGCGLAAVATELAVPNDHVQRFVTLIRTVSAFSGDVPEEDVEAAVTALLAAGHVVAGDSEALALSPTLSTLASRFITLDSFLTLQSGLMGPDGAISMLGILVIQGGVNDLLALDFQGGMVRFDSLSAAEVMRIVEHFLTKQEVLRAAVAQDADLATAEAVRGEPGACPNCGAAIAHDQAFCEACGVALSVLETDAVARPQFCTNCGKPMDIDSRFCAECGAGVG